MTDLLLFAPGLLLLSWLSFPGQAQCCVSSASAVVAYLNAADIKSHWRTRFVSQGQTMNKHAGVSCFLPFCATMKPCQRYQNHPHLPPLAHSPDITKQQVWVSRAYLKWLHQALMSELEVSLVMKGREEPGADRLPVDQAEVERRVPEVE